MTALAIVSPLPQFFDLDGDPLTGGSLYFGTVNANPETSPQTVYWDQALTQPAAQPITTRNGYAVRSGTVAPIYAAADYSMTVKDKRGRQVFYAASSADFTNITAATAALAAYQASLASTTAGQGAALVGTESSGTVQQYIKGTTNIAQWPGVDITGATSSRAAFQSALAYLTALGGGTLTGPVGTYLFDTSSEATCLVCTVPIMFDFPPGTVFKFSYYPLSLVNFVGCNGGGMRNIEMVFTGTRPGSTTGLTASHFGFNGTGLLSPPDFSSFVSLLGCSNVVLDNVQWRGNDTIGTNLKECGVQIIGGTATGPNFGTGGTAANPTADAVFSYGNKILRCKSNDVAFGLAPAMQDGMEIIDFYSDRYYAVAFVGAGHAIYNTGMSRGSTIRNLVDNSTQLFALTSTTFAGAATLQVRSWVNGVVDGVTSKRIEGLCGIMNSTSGSVFTNFTWRADQVAQEANLTNVSVITIVPSDTVSVQSGNLFQNWYIESLLNAGAARSANVSIFGSGGASAPSANIVGNVYDNINITHYPDSAYGKSIINTFGQRERWRAVINSRGTGTNKAFIALTGSAAGLLTENVVDVTLTGANLATYNLTFINSGGGNTVNIHGSGNVSQQNSATGAAAGDRVLHDDAMYSTDARLINNVTSHNVIMALTFAPTVPTPSPALTFVGSRLRFQFNATGVFAVTWPASFRKAVDGASAAGKSASTEFVCTDATTPVWVQQGGALTYN